MWPPSPAEAAASAAQAHPAAALAAAVAEEQSAAAAHAASLAHRWSRLCSGTFGGVSAAPEKLHTCRTDRQLL